MVGLRSFCLCYCFRTAHDGDTWCFFPCLASPLGGIPKFYHGGYKSRPFSFWFINRWQRLSCHSFLFSGFVKEYRRNQKLNPTLEEAQSLKWYLPSHGKLSFKKSKYEDMGNLDTFSFSCSEDWFHMHTN